MNRTCIECGVLIQKHRKRCVAHQRAWDAKRNADPKRQAYRDPVYRRMIPTGLCVMCGLRPATTRDHIYPLSLGGSNHPSNIQFLCLPCNAAKKDKV